MTAVRERMSVDVVAIPVDATLESAAREMRASGAGGLPVLHPDGHSCAGILTERDIVVRALAEDRDPRMVVVRDVATLEPITCSPGDDVSRAVALMRAHEIQRLPVVEGGVIVGVVSLSDIVFARPDEERGALDPEREEGGEP